MPAARARTVPLQSARRNETASVRRGFGRCSGPQHTRTRGTGRRVMNSAAGASLFSNDFEPIYTSRASSCRRHFTAEP